MKINFTEIFSLTISLLFLISSCKKKDDGLPEFTHRIISEKDYSNNQLSYESTFEYSGNKLSKMSAQEGNTTYQALFSYPGNKIVLKTSLTDGNNIYLDTTTLILNNNRVTEFLMAYDQKIALSYNSEGIIQNVKSYIYDERWILADERTYTYNSGKLVTSITILYGSGSNFESKSEFLYNGEGIYEKITSTRWSEGIWSDYAAYIYTYSAGKISRITSYYKNGTVWQEGGYNEFSYDKDDNLIKISKMSGGYEYNKTEFFYEEGSGNYRQIFEFFEYEYPAPMPNKKSQTSAIDFDKTHHFSVIASFNRSFSDY
jgi:hypothetical protein